MHFDEKVAIGFLTKLGVIVGALAAVLGPLSTVLDGDQTPEALGALFLAASALFATIKARGDQAAAKSLGAAQVMASALQSSTTNKPAASSPVIAPDLDDSVHAATEGLPGENVQLSDPEVDEA